MPRAARKKSESGIKDRGTVSVNTTPLQKKRRT